MRLRGTAIHPSGWPGIATSTLAADSSCFPRVGGHPPGLTPLTALYVKPWNAATCGHALAGPAASEPTVATSAYSAYQPPFVTWRWQGSSLLSGACGRCFHCGRCATSCRQGRLAGTLPAGRFWGGQAVLQAGVAEPVDGPDCAQDAATAGVSPSAQPPGQRRSYRDRRASSHTSAPSKGPWCPERRRGAAGHAGPPSRTRAGHGETTSLFVASSCEHCRATSRS